MKAFDGQEIVDLYEKALTERTDITEADYWTILGHTKITYAKFTSNGIQFRMETNVGLKLPICQYVTVTPDGEMVFRLSNNWFIPGDVLFHTFREAERYLEENEI